MIYAFDLRDKRLNFFALVIFGEKNPHIFFFSILSVKVAETIIKFGTTSNPSFPFSCNLKNILKPYSFTPKNRP